MKRSSRSIPTGPGSRGGRFHLAWWRTLYWRAWRAAHPDYREREARRRAEQRRNAQLVRDRHEVDELVTRLTSRPHRIAA